MLRFHNAELTYTVDTIGWYQRIAVTYRPDKDIVVQHNGPGVLVDSIEIEWVHSSDEEYGQADVQAHITGRTLNAKGKPDGRQTPGSSWVSTIDAASIDRLTDAWVTKDVILPTGVMTVAATIIREVFERRNQRAIDEAERIVRERA